MKIMKNKTQDKLTDLADSLKLFTIEFIICNELLYQNYTYENLLQRVKDKKSLFIKDNDLDVEQVLKSLIKSEDIIIADTKNSIDYYMLKDPIEFEAQVSPLIEMYNRLKKAPHENAKY